MANPNKKNKNKSPQSKGLQAGLKIALFFSVAFYWVGYEPWLSIFLAAIAGVCGGCIACWWEITDQPEYNPPQEKKKNIAYKSEIFRSNQQKVGLSRNKE